jgi:hypothetical protein
MSDTIYVMNEDDCDFSIVAMTKACFDSIELNEYETKCTKEEVLEKLNEYCEMAMDNVHGKTKLNKKALKKLAAMTKEVEAMAVANKSDLESSHGDVYVPEALWLHYGLSDIESEI